MTAPAFLLTTSNSSFGVASQTRFIPISGGYNSTSTTEARSQQKIGVAGTLSNLYINLNTNARTSSTTFNVRNNGANAGSPSAMACVFGSGVTGEIADTSNTAAVAVADLLNLAVVLGTGTQQMQPSLCSVTFTASSGTAFIFSYCDPNTGTVLSGTGPITDFMTFRGIGPSSSTLVEGNAQVLIPIAGTISYLTMQVVTNGRSTSTVVTFRKNTANGNNTFTYTSAQTGLKTDTTHTDAISVGDLICVSPVLGTGTGSFTVTIVGVTFVGTNDGESAALNAAIAATSFSGATNLNTELGGGIIAAGVNGARGQLGTAVVASKLWLNVLTNTSTTAPTFALLVGGSNGSQIITITALTSGTYQDTTNSDSIGATTFTNYQFTNFTTGGVTVSAIAMKLVAGGAVYSASISESGTAADSPSSLVSTSDAETESATAADSPSSLATLGASESETASAADTPSAIGTFGVSESESGTAADSPSSAATLGGSTSENAAASDSGSSSGDLGGSGDEAATIADSANAALAISATVSEAASATDADSMTLTLSLEVDETASALDDPSTAGHAFNDSVNESGGAADTSSTTATISASGSESGAAADHPASQAVLPASETESATASDTESMALRIAVAVAESTAVTDASSSHGVLGASDYEVGSAVDFLTAALIMEVAVVEAAHALDNSEASRILPIDVRFIIPSPRRVRDITLSPVRSIPGDKRGRVIPSEKRGRCIDVTPVRSFG